MTEQELKYADRYEPLTDREKAWCEFDLADDKELGEIAVERIGRKALLDIIIEEMSQADVDYYSTAFDERIEHNLGLIP